MIGLDADVPVRFAEGGAVPGDRIVGILTPGEGVTVYRIDSPELARFENALDRLVRCALGRRRQERPALSGPHRRRRRINEPGSLAQVAAVVAEHDGNIENITMTAAHR